MKGEAADTGLKWGAICRHGSCTIWVLLFWNHIILFQLQFDFNVAFEADKLAKQAGRQASRHDLHFFSYFKSNFRGRSWFWGPFAHKILPCTRHLFSPLYHCCLACRRPFGHEKGAWGELYRLAYSTTRPMGSRSPTCLPSLALP